MFSLKGSEPRAQRCASKPAYLLQAVYIEVLRMVRVQTMHSVWPSPRQRLPDPACFGGSDLPAEGPLTASETVA